MLSTTQRSCMITTTNELWAKAWAKETEGLNLETARRAGRATKENPNKEDGNWWNINGSVWVDNYIKWRQNNPD